MSTEQAKQDAERLRDELQRVANGVAAYSLDELKKKLFDLADSADNIAGMIANKDSSDEA